MPYKSLHRAPPYYSHLCVFECLCYLNLQDTATHKLTPHSTTCVFLGYPSSHKWYRCLDLSTPRFIISKHVVIDEMVFPFMSPASAKTASSLDFLLPDVDLMPSATNHAVSAPPCWDVSAEALSQLGVEQPSPSQTSSPGEHGPMPPLGSPPSVAPISGGHGFVPRQVPLCRLLLDRVGLALCPRQVPLCRLLMDRWAWPFPIGCCWTRWEWLLACASTTSMESDRHHQVPPPTSAPLEPLLGGFVSPPPLGPQPMVCAALVPPVPANQDSTELVPSYPQVYTRYFHAFVCHMLRPNPTQSLLLGARPLPALPSHCSETSTVSYNRHLVQDRFFATSLSNEYVCRVPVSPVPSNYPSALSDPNRRVAKGEEYQELVENDTWKLAPCPTDANVVTRMWILI